MMETRSPGARCFFGVDVHEIASEIIATTPRLAITPRRSKAERVPRLAFALRAFKLRRFLKFTRESFHINALIKLKHGVEILRVDMFWAVDEVASISSDPSPTDDLG
jgi:hypothetical protein